MATFRWQGKSPHGETLRGEMEAPTREAVIARLRTQRIRPFVGRIHEKGQGLEREIKIPGLGEKVKQRDVVIFTRQLATMLEAGLPIVQSLHVLAQQTPGKLFAKTIKQVKQDVEGGGTFAASLKKHSAIFDELYVNMISAGEVAGILDAILARLAGYMEKAVKLKSRLRGAMIYPASIVTVAVGVTALLLIFVIPVFADMFASLGKALPLPTQIALSLSAATIAYYKHMIVGILGLFFALRYFYRTELGRFRIDSLLLKIPIFGALVCKAVVARFTRTLGTLLSAGVPILDSLLITARTASNKAVEKAILTARQAISEGKTLSTPLATSGVFPPMACQMIEVGETTGSLDVMLDKIADFYDDEVDAAIGNLTSLMEPVMIVFLGIVIGGLVISMYLPIFQLGAMLH